MGKLGCGLDAFSGLGFSMAGTGRTTPAGGAGVQDDVISPEQWRARKTPPVRNDALPPQILFPEDVPFGSIKTEHITPFANRKDPIALNCRC